MRNCLVIDLEATCADDGSISPEQMEIIEIGAVWSTEGGEVLDKFQRFVRPIERPTLTRFCTKLTHIEQVDVDKAAFWPAVAAELTEFTFRYAGHQWYSWGKYDSTQIDRECKRHNVSNPLVALEHRNLKNIFAKTRGIKEVGMAGALRIVGLAINGTHHRALDDAMNIARLIPWAGLSVPPPDAAN